MTDDELKQLVASLAVAQKQTDAQLRQFSIELKAEFQELKKRQDQTDEQMKRTDEQMKRTDEQIKRTDEQMKRTDAKLERLGLHLGNISRNQGDVAEEFFYQSLIKDNRLGSIRFDDIETNKSKHRGVIQEEYDLFMTNGDAIAIVEVKYKAHSNDLDKLDRKMANFKTLFPMYEPYKLYAALASFHINKDTKEDALNRGYFVLQRCGDLIHSDYGQTLKVL